jgi:MFS family permease
VNTSRYKWSLVAMLWWIAFFNYADRQAIFSVFPLLEKEMHLTPVQLGLLGSSFAWVYGLFAPIAGSIVDRIRRKTAILGGLHLWSAICMATAASRGFGALLFFRGAEGLGESFYFPAGVSLISDYHAPETRSRALGFHQTSVYIGTIAGGFFAGWIAQSYGWRWSFIVFGGAGVVLGVMLNHALREPPQRVPTTRIPLADFARALERAPAAWFLLAAFLCANFVAVVLLSWMPKYLYDQFHMSLAAAGLTATVFVQLASLAGSPAGGWLADRLRMRNPSGRIVVQAIGVFGGAPFVVVCGLTKSAAVLIAALVLWGFFKGLYDANIFASIFDLIPPEARGTAAGFMNMAGWLGGGAAPVAVGFLAMHISLGAAIAMTAAMYVLAGMLLIAGMNRQAAR